MPCGLPKACSWCPFPYSCQRLWFAGKASGALPSTRLPGTPPGLTKQSCGGFQAKGLGTECRPPSLFRALDPLSYLLRHLISFRKLADLFFSIVGHHVCYFLPPGTPWNTIGADWGRDRGSHESQFQDKTMISDCCHGHKVVFEWE